MVLGTKSSSAVAPIPGMGMVPGIPDKNPGPECSRMWPWIGWAFPIGPRGGIKGYCCDGEPGSGWCRTPEAAAKTPVPDPGPVPTPTPATPGIRAEETVGEVTPMDEGAVESK